LPSLFLAHVHRKGRKTVPEMRHEGGFAKERVSAEFERSAGVFAIGKAEACGASDAGALL